MKRQRDGSECTRSGCVEKLFFFPPFFFSSWHTGKVWEILFEVHRCAHFKVHLMLHACVLPVSRRRDLSFPIRWNNENQNNGDAHQILSRHTAYYLISVFNSSSCLQNSQLLEVQSLSLPRNHITWPNTLSSPQVALPSFVTSCLEKCHNNYNIRIPKRWMYNLRASFSICSLWKMNGVVVTVKL